MTDKPAAADAETLTAFIDDRLDEPQRAAVAAWLAADPALAAQVALERTQRDALRQQLAPIAEEAIPLRLRLAQLRAQRRNRLWRRLGTATAALALLLTGAGGGWMAGRLTPDPDHPGAVMSVAAGASAAYRTFVVEVAHPVEVDTSQQDHLLRWLSKRVGRPLMAPDLRPFGYRLMGGRLLPGTQGAAAQLMYDDASGRRLTLFVEASPGRETAFRFRSEGEANTFAWIDQGFGFAVTGPLTRAELLPIAAAVYHRFEDMDPSGPRNGRGTPL